MDPVKDAFSKVKEDMELLREEMNQIRKSLIELCDLIPKMIKKQEIEVEKAVPAHNLQLPAVESSNPAHNFPFSPQKAQNTGFSTGNEGVPADRQTNQQTDKSSQNKEKSSINEAAEMLKSLDNLKEDIRFKFKNLTNQEWLIFSAIYQLDEEKGHSDYASIAARLGLTESSIRDYVSRLIKKQIPIEKKRVNNKLILLNISPGFKQLATLSTLLRIRDA